MEIVREHVVSAAELEERQPRPEVFNIRKGIGIFLFYILTLYIVFYMIISMWPLLPAFLVIYFHSKGIRCNPQEVIEVFPRVGNFILDLAFQILVEIMRFVMTF